MAEPRRSVTQNLSTRQIRLDEAERKAREGGRRPGPPTNLRGGKRKKARGGIFGFFERRAARIAEEAARK